MKTSMTFKSMTLIALLGAALAAPVLAQGGAGMGGGMGGGPGMMQGSGAGGGMGMGPGARGGRGGRAMMFNQNNTRGWSLMTAEERNAFQFQMREVKTYEECQLAQSQHRAVMEARAKEKGVNLMTPRMNGCDNMKARGWIK